MTKRRVLSLGLAFLLLVLLPGFTSALNVKEVFTLLPASCFENWPAEGDIPMADPIRRKALIEASEEKVKELGPTMGVWEVQANVKNGFIKITSNGDGEGAIFTMALWNAADGTKLAGVAIEQWTNVANDTRYIGFFRVKDDKLAEVTKDVLPKDITLQSFFDAHKDLVAAASKDGFRWWWVLPQKGTTIEVKSPSLELMDGYAQLEKPDHAYEGRWDGKKFTWVKVKPKVPAP